MKKNIIVTGATGMVGSEVIRQALIDDEIASVTALVRRELKIQHPKVRAIVHGDFLNYAGLEDVFKQNDACLWCLGISQLAVTVEEYQVITYDYAMAAAQAILKSNPAMAFLFLSGEGADSTEQSTRTFARYKGKTENALRRLGLKKFYIARPAAIAPVHPVETQPWYQSIVLPVIKILYPPVVVSAPALARALLHIVKTGPDQEMWDYKSLRVLGKGLAKKVTTVGESKK